PKDIGLAGSICGHHFLFLPLHHFSSSPSVRTEAFNEFSFEDGEFGGRKKTKREGAKEEEKETRRAQDLSRSLLSASACSSIISSICELSFDSNHRTKTECFSFRCFSKA